MIKKNWHKHSDHCYSVKNQNSFNAALYDYFESKTPEEKSDVRRMLQNWPKKYPTTIIIVDQSFECARVYIEQIKLI